MDDASDSARSTGFAAASAFLCMVATATFGVTDVLCRGEGGSVELSLAGISAVAFAFCLSSSPEGAK